MKNNKYKQVVKGMNISKATEDELHDLSMFELIDIILFYREELEHKERVCKEWKEEHRSRIEQLNILEEQLDQLKAELLGQEAETLKAGEIIRELKAEKEVIRNYLGCSDKETILQKLDAMVDEGIAWYDLSEHYKQALQEIKNFIYIEKQKVFVDMEDFWEQILQKCEVVNGHNQEST